ncbi:MAG: methyltransferase domain-containing protein, partial [Nostoc sp.]
MDYTSKARSVCKKIIRKLKRKVEKSEVELYPLRPDLHLPEGINEPQLFDFLKSVLVKDASSIEMENYCKQDFKRFVYTYGLARDLSGKCLELGANPYFTTILLKEFTNFQLSLANYFGVNPTTKVVQEVNYKDFKTGQQTSIELESYHFNIEEESFPFADGEFDVVLFCEIIEHLLINPVAVLKEIKR